MQGADYVIVVVLAVSLILGLIRGFVREAVMLVAWLAGIWVAWHYSYLMQPYLGGLLAQPGVQEWAGRAIVLLLVLLLGALLAAIARYFTHKAVGLEPTDRLLGGLFGLVRGIVILGLLASVGLALKLGGEPWWERSRLMPYVELTARWLERYAEPAVQQMLDEASGKAGQ